ncbi:hypothetical protein DFQ26_004588 [Actinomortierella ambigua]|nr:hypothetical protein DFQ26_004588 [Actinomortierella ambigua]
METGLVRVPLTLLQLRNETAPLLQRRRWVVGGTASCGVAASLTNFDDFEIPMTSAPRHFGYTAKFSVGTQAALPSTSSSSAVPSSPMNLLVDTGSDLIVVTSASCEADDCLLVPHKFDCLKSPTCSPQDMLDPTRRYRQIYGDGTVAAGTILRDSISFQAADGRKICVPEQSLLVVDQAGLNLTRSYGPGVDGIVGLNLGSPAIKATLLQNLQRIQETIAERDRQSRKPWFNDVSPSAPLGYMSLWLGKSLEPGQGGELMFGGIDWIKMAGSLLWSQRKPTAHDWSLVLDRGILVNGTHPLSHTPGNLAVIDSGSDGIYLQRSDYDELFQQIPGAIQLSTGYWRVPCRGSTFLSVSIEGREYGLPYHDWVEHEHPLQSTSGSEYPEGYCKSRVFGSSPGPTLLGALFLRAVYTVFDFRQRGLERVGFAPIRH